jgi:hypothetical protein
MIDHIGIFLSDGERSFRFFEKATMDTNSRADRSNNTSSPISESGRCRPKLGSVAGLIRVHWSLFLALTGYCFIRVYPCASVVEVHLAA